jgi:hypothetical protein
VWNGIVGISLELFIYPNHLKLLFFEYSRQKENNKYLLRFSNLSCFIFQVRVVEDLTSLAVLMESEMLVEIFVRVLTIDVTQQVDLADARHRTFGTEIRTLTNDVGLKTFQVTNLIRS